jgi:hypothetical protein
VAGISSDEIDHLIREQFRAYRATLRDDQRHLLERFQIVDMARKVVGVVSIMPQAASQSRRSPGSPVTIRPAPRSALA